VACHAVSGLDSSCFACDNVSGTSTKGKDDARSSDVVDEEVMLKTVAVDVDKGTSVVNDDVIAPRLAECTGAANGDEDRDVMALASDFLKARLSSRVVDLCSV
jgi:hypothetical protein